MFVRVTALGLAGLILTSCSGGSRESEPATSDFTVMSQAFSDGSVMPAEFTCDGADLSPPLRWVNAPKGTKSFALVMSDPDAPMGVFRHWGAFNIPAERRYVKAGDGLPNPAYFSQVRNSKDAQQYTGPCPAPGSGPHSYIFKVIALDKATIELSDDTSVGGLEEAIAGRKLGEATLTLTYERK
ncbi:MAG: YbhB/YbcL family Raf kinase inhibitor-like protein [Sphingomicrobium sp.]